MSENSETNLCPSRVPKSFSPAQEQGVDKNRLAGEKTANDVFQILTKNGVNEEYATKINSCKIWISTTGPVLDVSPRYFEVMMSKTLLFCNNMPYEYEGVFKDGVNCVTFENDLSDLEEKVKYYLDNDAERKKIIDNAYDMAISNYTWSAVTDRVVEKIREIKNDRV